MTDLIGKHVWDLRNPQQGIFEVVSAHKDESVYIQSQNHRGIIPFHILKKYFLVANPKLMNLAKQKNIDNVNELITLLRGSQLDSIVKANLIKDFWDQLQEGMEAHV